MYHQSALLLSVLLVLGLALTSASPIDRVLSRLQRNSDPRRYHYRQLHARTLDLFRLHRTLYTDFKSERYANESNPRVVDVVLSYLPIANFPQTRENFSDVELLNRHYLNLIIFKDTLNRVEETETGNVSDSLTEVAEKLGEVIHRLETAMIEVGLEHSIVRVPTNNPPFHSNVTREEHNTRTLLVLQEFDGYITEVLMDYKALKDLPSTSS